MLMQLRIKNIALIDELTVEFTDGMNCMTGETGAGKSIIIDAISCMLGFRTSREIIKAGCETAFVEGMFYTDSQTVNDCLTEIGIEPEEDGSLILQRELSVSGRNVCRINGRLTAVSVLRQIGDLLIDIHGQNENQSLMNTNAHVCLLDAYGGEEISEIKKKYEIQCGAFKKLYSSLNSFSGDPKERERLTDLYNFQIDEIQTAGLYVGEDEELAEKRNILLNSEKIAEALNVAREIIKGGDYGENISVCDRIAEARASMSSITSYSPDYAEVFSRIEEVSYLLEDISSELRVLSENVFFDKGQLEQTEEKINTINKLKRNTERQFKKYLIMKQMYKISLMSLLGQRIK